MIELMKLQGDSYMDITIGIVGIIPYAYPLDASEIYVRVRPCMSVYAYRSFSNARISDHLCVCAALDDMEDSHEDDGLLTKTIWP